MAISMVPEITKDSLFGHSLPLNISSIEVAYRSDFCDLKIMWLTKNKQRDSMSVEYPITEEKIISVLATMRMTC